MAMSKARALSIIEFAFYDGSCVRRPNYSRIKKERKTYHKGYELRFSVPDEKSLALLEKALDRLKIPSGSPYEKGNFWVLPVYSEARVAQIHQMLGERWRP